MAVREVGRYQTTDGQFFTNEKDAQRVQNALNNSDRKSFRLNTWQTFVKEQMNSENTEIKNLYTKLVNGDLGISDSQSFFERVWLGKITDIRINQREDYIKMLNTILGEDEAHLKVDGTYSFTIDGGAKFLMTKKTGPDGVPFDLNVSLSEGGESYRLSTVNGRDGRTFTLTRTDKFATIGTGLIFTNNILTLIDSSGPVTRTYTITWNG